MRFIRSMVKLKPFQYRIKRIVPLLLIAALLASLCGCGKAPEKDAAPTATPIPAKTANPRLSEGFRRVFVKLGYQGTSLQFRSDVHLIEYFIVGIAFVLFFKAMGWKPWIGLIAAVAFGLFEEAIKILLPTRHFSSTDLLKNAIGAIIAYLIFFILSQIRKHHHLILCQNFAQNKAR